MICFNVGQKNLYSKDSIKSILNKSDFRELFSKVKEDLFNDYKSTDKDDLRQYLSELFKVFNFELNELIAEEYKKNPSIKKSDIYPFGNIEIDDITEYVDSLKTIQSDPPLEEPVDGDELSNPTDQHLDEKDLAQRDNQFANFYTRIGDVLYPATIGDKVALVKEVKLEDGTIGHIVAAVLSKDEVKQYGIPYIPGKPYSGTVNKFFAEGITDTFDKVPSAILVDSDYKLTVNKNIPFTVTKSVRNRVTYVPESTFNSKTGLSLVDYNSLKKAAESDFATAFPGLTIVSSVLQINTGTKDDMSGFSVNTLGKPVLKIIARDSSGKIVNKQIGVELKPRPVSLNDQLVIHSDTFRRALDTLEGLGISNQMILSYANILSSFWTINNGQISKLKDKYPQDLIDELKKLNSSVQITDQVLNNLEDIITTYYGPVNGLFIAKNLNDFYKEYSPQNTTLASEKAVIKSMFEKFNGFQLDDKVVNEIFETSDLRSGNIITNILKSSLGHDIKNPLTNKEPNANLPIVINGITTTYGEVRELYRAARKKVVVIDKGDNNEKYVLQYEGQKIQIEKSFGKGRKKVNVRVFPNMNSVGRTMGNLQDITDIERDENGKPILQTKPRLRAGGGPLVKELARLFDSNKGIDQLSNREVLPGIEELYVANEDGKVIRMKPLLNNRESLTKLYLNKQAFTLRAMVNKYSFSIKSKLETNKANLTEYEKFFVKTKKGDFKLYRDVDLMDIEVRDGLLDFLEGVLEKNEFDEIKNYIEEDTKFIEKELLVEPPIKTVLDAIINRNNYDEDGYWIRSTTKIGSDYKGHYLRRNLSQLDSANDFIVNSYGRIEYKDSPDGFRYLPIAYAYLQDPKFKEFYNTEKERVNEFGLPDISIIERYIKDNGEQNIIDSFENKILPQLTTNYNGTQPGSLAVTQGRQQAAPTSQQPTQQTPVSDIKAKNADIEQQKQKELENKVKELEEQRKALRSEDGSIPADKMSEFKRLGEEINKAKAAAVRGNSVNSMLIKRFPEGANTSVTDPEALNAEDKKEAVDIIEQVIQNSKTAEEALKKIQRLGYVFDIAVTQNLKSYLEDRFNTNAPRIGNNKDSFQAWIYGKTDAELAALEGPSTEEVKPIPTTPVSDIEDTKADIERRKKQSLSETEWSTGPVKGLYLRQEPDGRWTSAYFNPSATGVDAENIYGNTKEEVIAELEKRYKAELDALEENEKDEFDNLERDVDFSNEVVNDFQIELEAARAYFRKQFPFASDKVLNFISKQAFNERFNTTGKAGAYTKGLIYVVSDGKAGMQVLRHEIFHKIFNEYLTEDERFELYNAFKNKYFPNSTVVDMKEFEEMLAIKYQDYERTGKETGIIQRIFNMILRLFNFIRVNTNSVEGFFEQIEAGKFAVVKTEVQDGVRYMSDPINKMGGIENYDRAIKQIKKDFYTLLIKGVTDWTDGERIKYYSTKDVRNRILEKINNQIEKATDETEKNFYKKMKRHLNDLIENAFSFVNSLDVKEKKKKDKEEKEDTTNDETANLKDHIEDKENQNELANSPERVRFWLSNIARPSKEGATAMGVDFINMGTAFAKLVELTSRLDFNGQIPFEQQLTTVLQTLKSDKDYKYIAEALVELINNTVVENINTKNVLFFNPLSAITIDPTLDVDLTKINLYDPVQLKLTKLDNGEISFTYDYYENGIQKSLTGFYHKKDDLEPVEFLKVVARKLRSLGNDRTTLKSDIVRLYNASVNQDILKDITKVISSNRERNIITLVKNSYNGFGSIKINFDTQVANNRQFALMQQIKASFIDALDNTELRKAFYTGKAYTPKVQVSENGDTSLIEPDEKTVKSIERSDIDAIRKVANNNATTQEEKSQARDAMRKVSSFLGLGLKFSNLNDADIKLYATTLVDILKLNKWGTDVLFDLIDKEEDVVVYQGTADILSNENDDSTEEQEDEDDEQVVIDTYKEKIGAYRYLNDFNNDFFNLSTLSLKGSNVEASLSERSRDGKNTNYRYIRKSYQFDVLNRLIFNTQSNTGIKIEDLNNSFVFLKSKWAQFNPFLNGTSKIYQVMLQDGTASISFANKEYFKKHSLESLSELYENALLYFAYYTKVNKGGSVTYFQQLPQQGDSTNQNSAEIDVNTSTQIKGKLKTILTQFVQRPTEEDLIKEYGYVPSKYNKNVLVDFNILAVALSKIPNISVRYNGSKNSYLIEGLTEVNDSLVDTVYNSYLQLAKREATEYLFEMIKNKNFKLPHDFFSGLLKDKSLIEILSSFTNKSVGEFTRLVKEIEEETKNKDGNHIRYKNKKSVDHYLNSKVQSLLIDIITAQVLNHGPNIFLIDQLIKGPSEFFGSPDTALKRRDSAGSPKEYLSVQTFDKDGNIIPGTERFARPNYKVVVVNDLEIVSDNREAFEKIVETFKSKYNIEEGQDLENIASNLLYNVQDREQLAKDLLGKEEISTEEMNDIVDLAYSYLNNTLSSRQLLRSFNLTDEDLQELDKEYDSNYEPTDGQGLHTTLRNAEIRANAGSNAEVDDILKPLHYEVLGTFGVPTMIKYSSVRLSEGFVENKPVMQKIKQVLERRGIDELVFGSTVKVGAPSQLISLQELLDDTDDDKINASTLTLSNNAYGLQLNPESRATKVSLFSQLLYFPKVTILDQNQVSRIKIALAEVIRSKSMAFDLDLYNSQGFVSNNVIQQIIKTAINPKTSNNSEIRYEIFTALEREKLNAYNHPGLMLTTERAFLGKAHDETIKTKFSGKKAVLVSSFATNNFGLKGFSVSEETQINANNLRTYQRTINGKKVLSSECFLPRGRYDADGNWTGILTEEQQNLIDEAIRNNQPIPEFFLTNYSKNNFFGLRIPTTGIHSAIPLMVKGFYDSDSDINGIIVPPDIVQRHGSDFDVDSLFVVSRATFGKNYKITASSDNINSDLITTIQDVELDNKQDRKELNKIVKELQEIADSAAKDRRLATKEEQAQFEEQFENSEWDERQRAKRGDKYDRELSLAGFMSNYYNEYRYVLSDEDQNGYFVYIGEIAKKKKALIKALTVLSGKTKSNKKQLEFLIKELKKETPSLIEFKANDYIGYSRVGNGFEFDAHFDESDPSKIQSDFLNRIDSLIPFADKKSKKALLEIRSKYFQNVMVEEFLNITESEENIHMMVTTIYMQKYKDWISKYTNNPMVPDISTPTSASKQRSIATAGRIGTGISAIGIKMLSYLSGYSVKDDAAIRISRNGNVELLNTIFNRSSNENRSTLKELDALVNLNIDNIKELGLYPLNLNENTEGIYIAMRMLGLSFDEANSIMVQPIVKYIAQQSGYTPRNISDLVKAVKGNNKKYVFPTLNMDSILNKPFLDTSQSIENMLSDPTQVAVLGVINSALQLNTDIRNINKIADTIRVRRNTKAEIDNIRGLVERVKNDSFIVNIGSFLEDNPHIKQAIDTSFKNLKVLEQKSINHSVKHNEILSAATNVNVIKKDSDPIRDSELKRKELIKFFTSGFVRSKSLPSISITQKIFTGNDLFMELMYKRHSALQKFARQNENLKDNSFIFNVVLKPSSVNTIQVEGKNLKDDSAAEYKMRIGFEQLSNIKETIYFETLDGKEISVNSLEELIGMDTFNVSDTGVITSFKYLRTKFEYVEDQPTSALSELQKDYFDYEVLKSGLEFTNTSMAASFTNQQHIDFLKRYNEVMALFTQEGDVSTVREITKLFDTEFTLNNRNGINLNPYSEPITSKESYKAPNGNFKYSYSGFDPAVGYYDLKIKAEKFDIAAFSNRTLPRVVIHKRKTYMYIGSKSEENESFNFYTEVGFDRKFGTYNFNSSLISNIGFLYLKQSLFENENVDMSAEELADFATTNGIDINVIQNNGKSIMDLLSENNNNSLFKASTYIVGNYYINLLNQFHIEEGEQDIVEESVINLIRVVAANLQIPQAIINNSSVIGLRDVVIEALSDINIDKPVRSPLSTETGVPRLKVRSLNSTNARFAYDYKMEYAFANNAFPTVDRDGNASLGIIAVISEYNDPMNYNSRLVKLVMKPDTINQESFSAIVDVIEPTQDELNNHYNSRNNYIYIVKEASSFNHMKLNDVLTDEMLNSEENPLNCPKQKQK